MHTQLLKHIRELKLVKLHSYQKYVSKQKFIVEVQREGKVTTGVVT